MLSKLGLMSANKTAGKKCKSRPRRKIIPHACSSQNTRERTVQVLPIAATPNEISSLFNELISPSIMQRMTNLCQL